MVFPVNKTFNIIRCITYVCADHSESAELVKFETPGTHSPTVWLVVTGGVRLSSLWYVNYSFVSAGSPDHHPFDLGAVFTSAGGSWDSRSPACPTTATCHNTTSLIS